MGWTLCDWPVVVNIPNVGAGHGGNSKNGSENRKPTWDDILWSQVQMMTWSRFLEVSILDTQDEKANLRNWFGGAMCEVFPQNAVKRLDLCYSVFEVFLKQKLKNLCVVSFICILYGLY